METDRRIHIQKNDVQKKIHVTNPAMAENIPIVGSVFTYIQDVIDFIYRTFLKNKNKIMIQ